MRCYAGLVAALGILAAAASATLIQICFRTQAQAQPVPPPADLVAHRDLRRSVFVDRLGGDRGAGGGANWFALFPALIALGILAASG